MSQVEQDVRLTDAESMQCPYANYAALHAREKGAHAQPDAGGWAVTRYADVRELTTDTERFSNHWHGLNAGLDMMGQSAEPYSDEVKALIAQYPRQMPNALLLSDPPISTRHRALVLKAMNTRRVRETMPVIQAVVDELIDDFADDGRCEFMSQFAGPLPGIISAAFLGLDREEVPRFFEWTARFVSGFIEPIGNERRIEVANSVIEYQNRMLELIAERRAAPQNDLLSDLIHAEIEDGEELDGERLVGPRRMTDPELLSIVIILITGGQHTTIGLIGNAMGILCENRELMEQVRSDPSLIPDFLEEALRIESPIQCTIRRARNDIDIWGEQLPADARLFAMWGAANQDPEMFPDPRTFQLGRPHVRKHFAFGHGPHFCVGAALARAQVRLGYEALLSRLTDIRLAADDGAGGPAAKIHPSMSARLYESLHLEFGRAPQ